MLQLVLPFSVLPIRLFSVLSSFAISSSRKRELDALLYMYYFFHIYVVLLVSVFLRPIRWLTRFRLWSLGVTFSNTFNAHLGLCFIFD